MKNKRNYFLGLMGLLAPVVSNAASINVIGDAAYSTTSFASADGGLDGGLGTNTRIINGTNVTWTKDNVYFVTDRLFIPKGATLTIEPGTKIYSSIDNNGTTGDKTDDKVGSIVACRGGKLIADGTASEPIVFTSVREWEAANGVDSPYDTDSAVGPAPTVADAGQWGGVILLGQAFISRVDGTGVNAGTTQIEGFISSSSPSYDGDSIPDATQYGVSTNFPRNDTDNSGIVRYVSIRHGGYEFDTSKEINGLTLGGVGSGTTIEYVEVYANQDDGIEFFGGTVNTKHMVMAFNQDDSFDIDQGYSGTNQFWLSIQNSGDADAGGEWDGVDGTSGGFSNVGTVGSAHHARPRIFNATMIGAGDDNTITPIATRGTGKNVNFEKGNFALHIEDYFNGEIYNSVFHDFSAGLMKFNDTISIGAQAKFVNNHIGDVGVNTLTTTVAASNTTALTGNGLSDARTKGFAPYSLAGAAQNGSTDVNTNPMFSSYTRNATNVLTEINPVPAPGSPLLTGALTGGAPTVANFRGAFGEENWADGWTKLSQSGLLKKSNINVIGDAAYSTTSFASANGGLDGGLGTNTRIINGTNVTWTKDKTYFVTDRLFIPKGATLTIEPGTKIYSSIDNNGTTGDKTDDKVGSIVACRGGKLIADGTASEPIVFTSVREWEAANGVDSPYDTDSAVGPAPTVADAGQWGGVILLGQAFISRVDGTGVNAGTTQIEGFISSSSPSYDGDSIPDATQYGVSTNFPRNDTDNSGIVRYVSIRHGGYEFDTSKEINGLTLGGVGSGTTIEYVEVYANQDDGIEFFGGTVNTKHMVMAFNQDDSFDIDQGYSGTNQFWLSIQNSGDADAGGEWDGVDGTSGGFSNVGTVGSAHHARPRIFNATMIGAGDDNTITPIATRGTGKNVNFEKGNFALHIEDYFNGEIYNSVFHDFSAGLMKFNDTISIGAQAKFVNNHIGDVGVNTLTTTVAASNTTALTGNGLSDARTKGFAPYSVSGVAQNGSTNVNTNPMFSSYTRNATNVLTALNPIPATGSPLLSGAISGGAPESAKFRGAFGDENWADGWTKLSQSGLLVNPQPVGVAPFADVDGDGISDTLEASTALTALGFSSSVNNVTNHGGVASTNLFGSLYTSTSIQSLRGTGLMIQASGTGPVTLTLPLFKSTDMINWTAAGNATATTPFVSGKQFYRVDLSSGAVNP